jgi:hypothetical protein
VTDTTNYAGSEQSSTVQLEIRGDATDEQREIARRSVEGMLAHFMEETQRRRSYDDATAKLTEAVNAPLAKLVYDDPGASAALKELSSRELLGGDLMDLDEDLARHEGGVSIASFSVGPPFDFAWSFHESGGSPPFRTFVRRKDGQVLLDARSGAVSGGADGWVRAHCGFGIFLPQGSGQKFPHMVLNPGKWNWAVGTQGVGGNATSEGGLDLAVFDSGQFVTLASAKLWRKRVSGGEDAQGSQPNHMIAGPELQFTAQAGHTYTVNAGIWAFTDKSSGIGAAAAASQLQGFVTKMWAFGY